MVHQGREGKKAPSTGPEQSPEDPRILNPNSFKTVNLGILSYPDSIAIDSYQWIGVSVTKTEVADPLYIIGVVGNSGLESPVVA